MKEKVAAVGKRSFREFLSSVSGRVFDKGLEADADLSGDESRQCVTWIFSMLLIVKLLIRIPFSFSRKRGASFARECEQ